MKWLIILALAVITTPAAFAQIGPDYNNIQNEDGTYTYTSHYNRIWDGEQWQNFIISETENNIIISSNAANTLSYDKQTCSYSIYDTGFIVDAALLPSVSWQANSAVNGTDAWNRMTVNDEVCMVEIINNGESVIIQSTKEITEDRDFEVKRFNPDNSTRLDIEIRNVLAERLIHTILINDKIKETIDIYNIADNTKLGATQTIHTDSINVGGQQLNLQDVSGQFFDRNWIEANEAQIFEVSDSLNYDFDVGFESLWGIGIESNQINLDFNNSPNATNHLNIDPTFTNTGNISGSDVTFTLSYPTLTNAIVSSGDIDGTALTSSQVISVQSQIDSTNTSWTTTANTTPASPDYSFDFSSNTGWTQTQSGTSNTVYIDTSNGYIKHDTTTNTSSQKKVYYDLGSALSDSAWVTTFKLDTTNHNIPSSTVIAFSSSTTDPQTASGGDMIAFVIDDSNGSNGYHLQTKDGGTISWGAGANVKATANETVWVKMIRLSATQVQIELFSDSAMTTSVGSVTSTIPSSITGVQYIQSGSGQGGNSARTLNASIDDLKIYDGVTSTTPTTNDLSITYTTATAPAAITDLSASFNTPNVDLSWSEPSSGGSALTSFKVYRDTGSGFSLYDTVTSSSASSYQDTNPVMGTTNFYKVNWINNVGESSDSNSASTLAGVPPDPPTSVNTNIVDTDASPLDILVTWSSPTTIGTGTLTGFELYRDSTLIQTLGLVSSYTDTVPNSGTFVYSLKAVSTHGSSSMSSSSSQTTPTAPAAITDLSATAVSNVQADLSWSAPSSGGSALVQYKILRDSVNIANTTSTTYSDSALSDGVTYLYNVFAQNNVGTSTASNSASTTTFTGVTGSITGSATTIGATSQLTVNTSITGGTPTPTFDTFVVKEGADTITTFTGSLGYIHLTDESPHTYTIESTDLTHWQQPTISGTISSVTAQYDPAWSNNAAYNFTRGGGTFDLTVNRDVPAGWDLDCEYRTSTQAAANQTGVHGVGSNMWAYSDTQSIDDGKHVYVSCMDGSTQVVSFTSYGPNLIQGGLNLLDTNFSDYLGAPAAVLFIILVAGMFTGRTANTGILVILALIGVLGFIGMIIIDEATWGFILIAGVLGLFVGRRFL